MKKFVLVLAVAVSVITLAAQGRRTLDIYVIDTEGGNATLLVTPAGESLLFDTGNAGGRDAARVLDAAKDAGLTQIDHLVTTHYHGDHFGGLTDVAAGIPVRHFIDHGANVQPNAAADAFLQGPYAQLAAKAKRTSVKAGDSLAMKDLGVRFVTAAGQRMQGSLAGAGRPNPLCAANMPQAPDPSENAQSVGTHVTFGRFKVLYLGDLTWNKEFELMCPNDPIGPVDLYVVTHHGQAISNNPVVVHAVAPRVSIMNNGIRKGGQPETMRTLFSSPGLEDLWQLHFSQLSGQEYTVPGAFIANSTDEVATAMPIQPLVVPPPAPAGQAATPSVAPQPPPPSHNGRSYWIKVSAQQDGGFTVTNTRNGFTKSYAARR